MKLFLVMHHHRHGVDAFLIMSEWEPMIKDLVMACDLDYEPDRDENIEFLEVDHIQVVEKDKVVAKVDVVSDACLHTEIVKMKEAAEKQEGHDTASLDPGMKAALQTGGQISIVYSAGRYAGARMVCAKLLQKCSCGMWRKV